MIRPHFGGPRRAGHSACLTCGPLLVALALAACSDEPADQAELERGRGVPREATAVVSPPPSQQRAPTPDPAVPPEGRVLLERVEETPVEVVEQVEHEGSETPLRNLPSELDRLVGDPTSCLSEQDRHLRRDIGFDVDVDVTRSGIVTRVSVDSPGVSADAIDCVRGRLTRARFAPLERSQTVHTSLLLQRSAPPDTPTP